MPFPVPNEGESNDDFHSRCMDSEVMKAEAPDMRKRNAICFSQARQAGRKIPKPKKK